MSRRPNLIYIFADQWRRQAMGFMNEDPVITPNIDKFSKESVVFDNSVCVFPLCTPARGAMLTGKYPLSIGLDTNCRTGYNIQLPEDEIAISDILKKQGYQTGYIGKLHLDEPEKNYCENPKSGAEHWDAFTPVGRRRHGFDFWYSYGAMDNHMSPHYWMDTPDKIQIKDKWSVEHETDIALDYLEGINKEEPFALFVSWNPPHPPYEQVPEKYLKMYENRPFHARDNDKPELLNGTKNEGQYDYKKHYFAAVTGVDDNFGRIISYLEENNLMEDTIIVLSADHGDMFGSHGFMGKHQWQEESVGIPFMIKWGNHTITKRDQTVISTIDHMPSILGLMNIPIEHEIHGEDFSKIMLGQEKGDLDNFKVIMAYAGYDKEKRLGFDKYSMGWRAIRTNNETYVLDKGYDYLRETQGFLYNLKEDPYQLKPNNVGTTETNVHVKDLKDKLKAVLESIDDPFFNKL